MSEYKDKNAVRDITLMGVILAFICVLSALPLGINILGVAATLQVFVVSFAGFVLGARRGGGVVALYVIIGLMLPVYSNMTSGPGILFGPTGGFLFGFILLSCICGLTIRVNYYILKAMLSILGVVVCHIMGMLQFVLVTDMDIVGSILTISLPYLPKDIMLVALGFMVSIPVKKSIKSMSAGMM